MINVCPKLRNGSLKYDLNPVNRTIQLVEDIPSHGAIGGSFDSSIISFDTINQVLQSKPNLESRDFAYCFPIHSANNGPMLVAALIDMGVLCENGTKYTVLKLL